MTNPSHTPGPWKVNEIGGTDARTQFLGADGALNFEVWDAITDADAAHIVACVNACEGINPDAVPDLLAALEAFVAATAEGGIYEPEHAAARAAIAKAKAKGIEKKGVYPTADEIEEEIGLRARGISY